MTSRTIGRKGTRRRALGLRREEVARLADVLWSMFMDKGMRTTMPAWETAARVTVARFRLDAARAKDRSEFDTLAAELARVSPEFARLWSEYDVVEVTEGSKEIGHHGSRVDGEGTDAMRLAARIERQGEQGVRRLRLSVRFPLVVGASLELRILEVDPRAAVPARRQRHHPGAIRLAQRWPESRRELEVADVIRRELRLEPARIAYERRRHDSRVVHEHVERPARRHEACGERIDRRRVEEIDVSSSMRAMPARAARAVSSVRAPTITVAPASVSARVVSIPIPA